MAGRRIGHLAYEQETLEQMIKIYCRGNHATSGGTLCTECAELLSYATQRLQSCKFGNAKSFCSNCQAHCYRPAKRNQIKVVMRYSGPRLLFSHPIMAARHLLETKKQKAINIK